MLYFCLVTNKRKWAALHEGVLAVLGAATFVFSTGIGVAAGLPADKGGVDFSRDILPIFSDNCFQCHGPDEKARKAKFRLDTKEGAFRLKDGKTVIVPGKSAESELFRRITTGDPDDLMPPPESNHKLTPKQIDLIKVWIDEGAKWGRHWAFNPIESPRPPRTKNQRWPVNEIDRFVLARLEQEGLRPAAEADRERLIRRVTFDLTGLPPTPSEIDAFLADKSSNAYEKVVDRLLNSPRYGERMAAQWLDLARYADTYGYQMDAPRQVWPYRDWVIRAFNENLPFDQFVTWQLAGDLLPDATKDQRLATAFNRLHLQNEEGGIVEEEFRVSYVVDRVDTFGTAFLGLTLECSRCHDHKFDPITMSDFYSLFAFFQTPTPVSWRIPRRPPCCFPTRPPTRGSRSCRSKSAQKKNNSARCARPPAARSRNGSRPSPRSLWCRDWWPLFPSMRSGRMRSPTVLILPSPGKRTNDRYWSRAKTEWRRS